MSRKSSISKCRTHAEIGDFWHENDLSDYWDKTCSVRADVEL